MRFGTSHTLSICIPRQPTAHSSVARSATELPSLRLPRNQRDRAVYPGRPFHQLLVHGGQGEEGHGTDERTRCCGGGSTKMTSLDIARSWFMSVLYITYPNSKTLQKSRKTKRPSRPPTPPVPSSAAVTRNRRQQPRPCPSSRPSSVRAPGAGTSPRSAHAHVSRIDPTTARDVSGSAEHAPAPGPSRRPRPCHRAP